MYVRTFDRFFQSSISRAALLVMLTAVLLPLWSCAAPVAPVNSDPGSVTQSAAHEGSVPLPPSLEDFWNGDARFEVETADTGLPMGESDTVVLPDGGYRSYVHASDRSLGVVDSCGAPVPFPGCVVAFESGDKGHTFQPVRDAAERVTCLIPCSTCPCDSRRDHIDQQQYPRVARVVPESRTEAEEWRLVYEYRGSVFARTSADGLTWSAPAQVPQTGTWRTWLMPCRTEESIGPHPHTPHQYDCLVGGPPGLVVTEEDGEPQVFVFVGLGQNPGSMGCYRGTFASHVALLRKCDHNPLFTGSSTYGSGTGAEANEFFDFRTVSSADVVPVGDRYYMLYEGVRGPEEGAAGDTQFALGLARSMTDKVDGSWETYASNPILLDVPGNIGVGHADVVVDGGETIVFTSLDGETRSRLVLRWK